MVIYLLFELCSFFRTRNKLESCKKVCENKDFCNVVMPSEDTKIVELDQYRRSNKASYITNADLESLIGKIDGCENIPEKLSATKLSEYTPSGFSMSTIYRGKYCRKCLVNL